MSKESIKRLIEGKRKENVTLRTKIETLKEQKKRKTESLARSIKSTTSASQKEYYRKQKISESARYDREIDSLKRKVEDVKRQIENYKKQLAAAK